MLTAETKLGAYGQTNPLFTATYPGSSPARIPMPFTGTIDFSTTRLPGIQSVGSDRIDPSRCLRHEFSLIFSMARSAVFRVRAHGDGENSPAAYGSLSPAACRLPPGRFKKRRHITALHDERCSAMFRRHVLSIVRT